MSLFFLSLSSYLELPDVALLDMRMPVMDGIATAAAIAQQYPTIKILVLTTFDEDALIAQAMSVGASGYLLKDTPSEELAIAIRSVAKGYSQFGPGIMQKMLGTFPQKSENNDSESPSHSNRNSRSDAPRKRSADRNRERARATVR